MPLQKNVYTFSNLIEYKDIVHGLSTRAFGSIKNKGVVNSVNLNTFAKTLHIPSEQIVLAKQIHSGNVGVFSSLPQDPIENIDGFIATQKNIFVGIVTADCLPILFYDPEKQTVGAAHAGYKGIINQILQHMIDEFQKLGSSPKDIRVSIGPGIGICCYDISMDRVSLFEKTFPSFHGFIEKRDGKHFLDLKKLAQMCLVVGGIDEKNIEVADNCTKDNIDQFFSYRGEGAETYGEFISLIGML